jgi:transposase-like protein
MGHENVKIDCPRKTLIMVIGLLQVMEGVQKSKCTSCGITFMSENNNPLCPTCSENSNTHNHGDEHGCGCGGH